MKRISRLLLLSLLNLMGVLIVSGSFLKAEDSPSLPLEKIELPLQREYKTSRLQLGPAYRARLVCACLYIMEQSPEVCQKMTEVSPAIFPLKIDESRRSVRGGIFFTFLWSVEYQYIDSREGCRALN